MTASLPPSETPAKHQTWVEIEQVVASFAQLAKSDISLAKFAAAWLEHLLRVLPASGGAIWSIAGQGSAAELLASANYPLPCQASLTIDCKPAQPPSVQVVQVGERDIVQAVVAAGEQGALVGEVTLLAGLSPRELEGTLRLMHAFGELVEDYQLRRELTGLRGMRSTQRAYEQFLLRIHGSLDPLATAYAIANDGRAWLECSRVTVVRWRAATARVLAISGVDSIDPRAEEVCCLRELAAATARLGEPLYWSGGSDEELPPQLASALHACLDRGHAKRLAAIPLRGTSNTSPAIAIVIAEWLDESLTLPVMQQRVNEVARHSAVALARAFEHDLPLLPAFTALARIKTWLATHARWAIALLLVGFAAVLALLLIPAELTVEARGTLQPRIRRHLFSPADGVVEEVAVEHGAEVRRGSELLKLRDAQLEFEFSRVMGELETSQARLATIRARRASRSTAETTLDDERLLAAEEEQLKQKLLGLETQLQVLKSMRADLTITSPIDGQVLTWHARDLLAARPVKRGQLLLTIADPRGAWGLELNLAEADIGHVLDARRASHDELPVTFLLATDPAQTHHGSIEQVATNSEAIDGQPPSTLVMVRLAENSLPQSRAGAGVIAHIHCGRHALGYVWLHDLLDAIRTRLRF